MCAGHFDRTDSHPRTDSIQDDVSSMSGAYRWEKSPVSNCQLLPIGVGPRRGSDDSCHHHYHYRYQGAVGTRHVGGVLRLSQDRHGLSAFSEACSSCIRTALHWQLEPTPPNQPPPVPPNTDCRHTAESLGRKVRGFIVSRVRLSYAWVTAVRLSTVTSLH